VIGDLLDIILDAIYWIWRLGPRAFFLFVFMGLIFLIPLVMLDPKVTKEFLPYLIGFGVLIIAILVITWLLAKLDYDIWNKYEMWK